MAQWNNNLGENTLNQKDLELFSHEKFPDGIISRQQYIEDFLMGYLVDHNKDTTDLQKQINIAVVQNGGEGLLDTFSFSKKGILILHLSDGKNIQIDINSIKNNYFINPVELEKEVEDIQNGIHWIMEEHNGIFWGGADANDKLETDYFGVDLYGKTLAELQELLQLKQNELFAVYNLRNESRKKIDIIKKELDVVVGLGDEYESGVHAIQIDEQTLTQKVSSLVQLKSIPELFSYIIEVNNQIDSNWKQSDMVKISYNRFLNLLYSQTFEKLKGENATNTDFLNFAKLLTGRQIDATLFDKLSSDAEYESTNLANKVLLYVMSRSGGVFDNMSTPYEYRDPLLEGKNPQDIISSLITELDTLGYPETNYGEKVLKESGYENVLRLGNDYSELSFEQKVTLGGLFRLLDVIKNAGNVKLSDTGFLKKLFTTEINQAFTDANNAIGDNWDASLYDWNGKNAKDLGLTGEFAEIFDLYQDINGSSAFDMSDNFENWFQEKPELGVMLGVGLIAGAIILSPIALSTATFSALFIAGAKIGAIASISGIIVNDKGYDSIQEAVVDISTEVGSDSILGGLWFAGGVSVLRSVFHNATPNFLSLSAASNTEKGIILSEVLIAGMAWEGARSQWVKNSFSENHVEF